jgi:hypothetical protein
MKTRSKSRLLVCLMLVSGLFLLNITLSGQETLPVSSALPANIKAIVTNSCMPCHSSNGGLMSKTNLNLTNWAEYTPEKQKEKADKMYSELKNGGMPPKKAREAKPEIIPTAEQVEIIKNWAASLSPINK